MPNITLRKNRFFSTFKNNLLLFLVDIITYESTKSIIQSKRLLKSKK